MDKTKFRFMLGSILYGMALLFLYVVFQPNLYSDDISTWFVVSITLLGFGLLQRIIDKENDYIKGFTLPFVLVGTILLLITSALFGYPYIVSDYNNNNLFISGVGATNQNETSNRVQHVLNKEDSEHYELAKMYDDIFKSPLSNAHYNTKFQSYAKLTKDEVDTLYGDVDIELLNEEFSKRINEYRESLGLQTLTYYPEYLEGTTQIAKELSEYGFIAPIGQEPHTRPYPHEGLSTLSVFDDFSELEYTYLGENLAYSPNILNPYVLVSEKYLANHYFERWLLSEGHRKAMETSEITGFSFVIMPSYNGEIYTAFEDEESGHYTYYYKLKQADGYGLIGVLTLIGI